MDCWISVVGCGLLDQSSVVGCGLLDQFSVVGCGLLGVVVLHICVYIIQKYALKTWLKNACFLCTLTE